MAYDDFEDECEPEYFVILTSNDDKESVMNWSWEAPPTQRQILHAVLTNGILPSGIKSFRVTSVSEELGLFAEKDWTPLDARSRILQKPSFPTAYQNTKKETLNKYGKEY